MDACTPGSLLEDLAAKLQAHHEANEGEFTKAPKCSLSGAADPMKIQLSVSYELTHNGAGHDQKFEASWSLSMAVSMA